MEPTKSPEILVLEEKVTLLENKLANETKRLREAAGAWRRKAENKGGRRESMREGYNAERGTHYKVDLIDLPTDLNILEVLKIIKEEIVPTYYPYTFRKVDYSKKFNGWLIETEKELNINMGVDREFILQYYLNTN